MPGREETVDGNPVTGVAFPKFAARRLKRSWKTVGCESFFIIAVLYTVGIWIAARSLLVHGGV
jgi:hypothetical protein